MATQIPRDLDAEKAVLGALLLDRENIEPVLEILDASYFYRPVHGNVFSAIEELYRNGEVIDTTTVGGELKKAGLADEEIGSTLMGMMNNTPAFHMKAVIAYAKAVESRKVARDVIGAARDAREAVVSGADPFDVVDELTRFSLSVGQKDVIQTSLTVPELIEAGMDLSQTVIPDLMFIDQRVIVTAKPGTGKSSFLKFIGYCASQGIHPFRRDDMMPVRVLSVDAENPGPAILNTLRPLQATLQARSPVFDDSRFRIMREPGGLNIRKRRERTQFQREIALHKPSLVVMGPVYKMTRRESGESWESAAEEFVDIIDDLRIRYEFAVMMEAHPPKGAHDADSFGPAGSAVLGQWAETGIALKKENPGDKRVFVDRFREDRIMKLGYPPEMVWDPDWIFEAVY